MAERTFELPDLGEGIVEGELVSWLVATGDHVEEDQTIAEVETDKALVEIPSPYDGVVTTLHFGEGEMVPVDSVIATFEVGARGGNGDAAEVGARGGDGESGETAESTTEEAVTAATGAGAEAEDSAAEPPVPEGRVFAAPTTRTLARELGVDIATVSGSGAGDRITEADVRAAADGVSESGVGSTGAPSTSTTSDGPKDVTFGEPAVTRRDAEGGSTSNDTGAVQVERDGANRARTLAMPATRRLAAESGVNIDDVPASEERDGEAFVTPEDVRAYLEAGEAAGGPAGVATASAEGATESAGVGSGTNGTNVAGADQVSGERIPYRGVRRAIGEQMARSKYTAPHVSHHDEFDAAELVDVRRELADVAQRDGVKLTYLPFVVKAVTAALQELPALNSSLDEEAEEIVLHDEYNVGIAVATDAGLMVPVVENADRKGLKELAEEIADLAERARSRELSPEEMRGGTFTITNIGVVGGEYASPIINYPEAAILAMGPIKKRPWVVEDEVVARETMTLSMSVDHRLVDGAEAAQFTNRVKEYLGYPSKLLLD